MFNTLEKSLYCIYDKKLKLYSNVFLASGPDAKKIYTEMANDVSSPQYGFTSDYDCVHLANFDEVSGVVDYDKYILCGLDTFIDERRIELQYMISTLNFLPSGYFKMPAEMQQEIKDNIDIQTKKYAEYLCSQMDVSTSTSLSAD